MKVILRKLGKCRPGKGGTPYGIVSCDGDVYIDPRQLESEMIDTMVHELLHVAYPHMSEDNVRRGSKVVSDWLWKNGYRRRK